jgi:membrane protein DedA with SNARE-associated domain
VLEYLGYLLPYFVRYRYLAIFFALTTAGFGVPIPEELTIIISGYLTALGHLHLGLALLICYLGVLAGDLVTYSLGRFGASRFLESRYSRWIITPKQLEQVQYYYRGYGPYYLLGARQVPGLRFPSFFVAGMVRMHFGKFLLFDSLAAMVSMPVVFVIAFYFGPQLENAVNLVLNIRDVTFTVGLAGVAIAVLLFVLYWYFRRDADDVSARPSQRGNDKDGP